MARKSPNTNTRRPAGQRRNAAGTSRAAQGKAARKLGAGRGTPFKQTTKGRRNIVEPRVRRAPRAEIGAPDRVLQAERVHAMRIANNGAGVLQDAIVQDVYVASGRKVTRQAVGSVIRDRYCDDDIIESFCRMTGTKRAAMFPAYPTRQTVEG